MSANEIMTKNNAMPLALRLLLGDKRLPRGVSSILPIFDMAFILRSLNVNRFGYPDLAFGDKLLFLVVL
jgi:hypothetical protein